MNWDKKLKARKIADSNRKQSVTLKQDLKKYLDFAREAGASDSKMIPARWVRFDERVRLKCEIPKCHLYGSSPNCPPYTPDVETMRKATKKYRWAVLVKRDVSPIEDFIHKEQWLKSHEKHQRKIHDIVSAVESAAFNDGYYFAVGFSAGGCKTALCGGLVCQYLDSGRCRFPLKARPSMEGVGIDAYRLAARVGWDIYPVASRYSDPDSIKCAVSLGLVFIN